MSGQVDDRSSADPPGCTAAAVAMTGATVPIAAGLTIVLGWPGLFVPILLISMAIVALFGSLGFVMIRRRVSALGVVGAGLATGAIIPALGVLISLGDGTDVTDLLEIVGFGLTGIVGAVITWSLLVWQERYSFAEQIIVGSALLCAFALAFVL